MRSLYHTMKWKLINGAVARMLCFRCVSVILKKNMRHLIIYFSLMNVLSMELRFRSWFSKSSSKYIPPGNPWLLQPSSYCNLSSHHYRCNCTFRNSNAHCERSRNFRISRRSRYWQLVCWKALYLYLILYMFSVKPYPGNEQSSKTNVHHFRRRSYTVCFFDDQRRF